MSETTPTGESPLYLNTYKLNPIKRFDPDKVKVILESVLSETIENLTYDGDKCIELAAKASEIIRSKVKELKFDRYKLICIVTIGEKQGQDVKVTCSFLWDIERDRFAIHSEENLSVFAIAQCFGLYYE